MVRPGSQSEQVGRLIIAGFIIMALPSLPFGNYLSYPFMILTTWFHEMGHGITAIGVGQEFEQLQIFADGSGVAISNVSENISPFAQAAISAGGLLAPTLVGAALIMASAHENLWRGALWLMSGIIFVSVILYVRSPVGFAVLPLIALTIAIIAWKAPSGFTRFTLQFLGLLGAMSMLRDYHYLFTENIVLGGRAMLSDTGKIEQALFLPHWMWAGLIIAIAVVIVFASFKYALSEKHQHRARLPVNVVRFNRGTGGKQS